MTDDAKSKTTGYHVFYTRRYGESLQYEFFVVLDDVLEIVQKANEDNSDYRNMMVIHGDRLEFEPYQKVTAWRVVGNDSNE